MYQRLWSWLLYLFGVTMQVFWNCDYNDKVTAGSLNKTQYQCTAVGEQDRGSKGKIVVLEGNEKLMCSVFDGDMTISRHARFGDQIQGLLDTELEKYSGKWYFIMIAADSDNSLLKFRAMDSAVFLLTPMEAEGKLLLRGELRHSETTNCLSRQWTYYISNQTQEMILEGRPEQRTEIFVKDGDDYIMLLEVQEEGPETFKRLMLYGRSPTLTDGLRLDFKHRARCMDLTSIFVLKQAQAPCEIS